MSGHRNVRTAAGTTFYAPGPPRARGAGEATLPRTVRERLCAHARQAANGAPQAPVDLTETPLDARRALQDLLGTGEVTVEMEEPPRVRVVESSLPGIWQTYGWDDDGSDRLLALDAAPLPDRLRARLTAETHDVAPDTQVPDTASAMLAPVLAEIGEWLPAVRHGHPGHAIDLSRMPLPPNDIVELKRRLGAGPATLHAGSYGGTRVTPTGLRHVWWVQHFDASQNLIVNAIEITGWPSGVAVPWTDLADSADELATRLDEGAL